MLARTDSSKNSFSASRCLVTRPLITAAMDIDVSSQVYGAWQKWKRAWHLNSSGGGCEQDGRKAVEIASVVLIVRTKGVKHHHRVDLILNQLLPLWHQIGLKVMRQRKVYVVFKLHVSKVAPLRMNSSCLTPVHQSSRLQGTSGVSELHRAWGHSRRGKRGGLMHT